MRNFLAPAHLALTIVILVWDIVLAGRMAQNRKSPRAFQAICGIAALFALPGLLFALATSTVITGRSVAHMDWFWPAVLIVFAVQAVYALARNLVNWVWGFPIAIYDLLIAAIGITRYCVAHGFTPPEPLVTLLASQSIAMVFASGTPSVLASPLYLNMPMISPAFPALRPITATFRLVMSVVGLAWTVIIIAIGGPRAIVQLRNYEAHRRDPLRERPDADFAVGIKILPDVAGPPPPAAIKSDSALIDSLDVDAISVVVRPGASRAALDSLAHVIDPARRDSLVLIVAIGYRGNLMPELRPSPLDEALRIATIRQVVARLHPDILLPAEDPYGSGERSVGTLPPERW